MRKFILSLALAAAVLGGALLTPRSARAQDGYPSAASDNGYHRSSYDYVSPAPRYSSPNAYPAISYGPYNNPMNAYHYNPTSARYPSYYQHSPGYTTTVPTYFYYRPGYGYTYSRGQSR